MDSNHGEVVGLRHLIQGNPQASGYIFERHALIEVAGKNELLQRREGLHRVHRYRQHAGQLGLVLDVLWIGVIMARVGGVVRHRAAGYVCLCLVDLGHAHAGPGRQVLGAVANVQAADVPELPRTGASRSGQIILTAKPVQAGALHPAADVSDQVGPVGDVETVLGAVRGIALQRLHEAEPSRADQVISRDRATGRDALVHLPGDAARQRVIIRGPRLACTRCSRIGHSLA
jgi:hypothetical protein